MTTCLGTLTYTDIQNGNLWADEGNSNYKEIISKFNKTPT